LKAAQEKAGGGEEETDGTRELAKGEAVEYDDRAKGRKVMVTVVHIERAVGPG